MNASDRVIHETTSLCRVCKNGVAATVVANGAGEVWMHKECVVHGPQEVQLSDDADWYERTRAITPRETLPSRSPVPIEHGCPFDCGPCEAHVQRVRLPVVTITSACNLDCPICYVINRNDNAYYMSTGDFRQVVEHLVADHDGEVDIINLTGGEPTQHPELFEMLEIAKEVGVRRVTVCSNGLVLARDEDYVRRLAEYGARIALSFDSFEAEADVQMQGARLISTKMRCLELLEAYDVDTTLIPVMTRGVNDHEIGRILDLALSMRNIRHVEVHTITFTGQGGTTFDRSTRTSMHEALCKIEEHTGGLLTVDDYVPSPHAHPLCYQVAYLLMDPEGGRPVPFTRFMDHATLYDLLADQLYMEPSPKLERAMQTAIDRVWVEEPPDGERILRLIKGLLGSMFPKNKPLPRAQAMAIGERAVKAVYVHSHMDEETFDTERIVQCCDSNCYPDGRRIPVCSYNVLYREKEPAFNVRPLSWNERSGGRRDFRIDVGATPSLA